MKTQKSKNLKGADDGADHNHSVKDSDEGAGKKSFFDYLHKVQAGKEGNDGEGKDAKGKDKKN